MCEKLFFENHGGVCKVGILESIACQLLAKFDFWGGILEQKKQHFSFYGWFIYSWRRKLLNN